MPRSLYADAKTGIGSNIREAYAFLCLNWNPGDEIVLIGFSRGAFTVRVIAELVNDLGLLKKEALKHLVELYQSWKSKRATGTGSDFEHPEKRRTDVQIKACAVWDTVAALKDDRLSFVNESIPKCVQLASHALALNEERDKFRPLLWEDADGGKLRQCWFLGTHSDVGGGNEEQQLANISLMWMISQLQNTLGFDADAVRSLTSDPITEELHRKRSKGASHSAISQAHPTQGYYELQLKLPVVDFQARTRIKVGTATKLQYITGWTYREPFKSGPKTREKIHWTVSILIQKGIVAPCNPLELAIGDRTGIMPEVQRVSMAPVSKRHLPGDDPQFEVRDGLEQEMIATWIAQDCLRIAQMHEERDGGDSRKTRMDIPSQVLPFYLVLLEPDEWRLQEADIGQASLDLSIQGRLGFKAHPDGVWQYSENKPMSSSVSRTRLEAIIRIGSLSIFGIGSLREIRIGGLPEILTRSSPEIRVSQEPVILEGWVQVPFHPSLYRPDLDIALRR
jgi:hypothetical protein